MSSPHHHAWNKAIHTFLINIGFHQAANGFATDFLVMNPDWETSVVPEALKELTSALESGTETTLDERKLDYVQFAENIPARTPSTINKEISRFLAKNRARSDNSNRSEFLYTPAQKRQRLSDPNADIGPSCARTDAKPLDRDLQMEYDIYKIEGPLSRTIAVDTTPTPDNGKGKQKAKDEENLPSSRFIPEPENEWTASKHPGLDERLRNIETHLSVRYVPSIPRTLLSRLKFLEEHLIRLEKDYPPWAALHFNQPNRGWPPPPRQTPIIVAPPLRSKEPLPSTSTNPTPTPGQAQAQEGEQTPQGRKMRNTGSSLHRAVLEKLEVIQAMTDLS